MPWIISPWNGNLIEVTETSILLKNNPVVSPPSPPKSGNTGGANTSSSSPHPVNSPGGGSSSTSPVVAAQQSAKDKRRAEVAKLTLSTVPAIANIQRQAQAEYVESGKWNPAYEAQAEAIRKGLNPLYPGGEKGFTDPQYFLPGAGSDQPSISGFGTLFDGLTNAIGKGGAALGQAAGNASGGTLLIVGGIALLLLFGRRSG